MGRSKLRENRLIVFLGTCLLAVFMASAQASDGHDRGHGFTEKSPYGANIRTGRMILLIENITDNLFVHANV